MEEWHIPETVIVSNYAVDHYEGFAKERRETLMATNTFERKIEITDPQSVKKLITVMEKDRPVKSLSDHPYTEKERERSVSLLKQCLSRSKT